MSRCCSTDSPRNIAHPGSAKKSRSTLPISPPSNYSIPSSKKATPTSIRATRSCYWTRNTPKTLRKVLGNSTGRGRAAGCPTSGGNGANHGLFDVDLQHHAVTTASAFAKRSTILKAATFTAYPRNPNGNTPAVPAPSPPGIMAIAKSRIPITPGSCRTNFFNDEHLSHFVG